MTSATSPEAQALFRSENHIFSRWLGRSPGLLRDGALGGPHSTYVHQSTRVLFVLKEANDTNARWSSRGADLRQHAVDFAALRSTFPVLLLLAALAHSPASNFEQTQSSLQDPERRRQLLESIALVNLKKTPGGPVCNDRSLLTAVAADGDLLLQQLELYHPHLTIAGGSSVFSLLARLLNSPITTGPGTRPSLQHPTLGLCLSFFHPQATKGYHFLHDLLRDNLEAHSFHPAAPTMWKGSASR